MLEYYHNGRGCQKKSVRQCFPPFGDATPGGALYRRNSAFAQYFNNEFLVRPFRLSIRGTLGIDDKSGLISAIASYDLNDNAELFSVLERGLGSEDDEFVAIEEYSVMAGVSVTF